MTFLPPNQQRQSTEGTVLLSITLKYAQVILRLISAYAVVILHQGMPGQMTLLKNTCAG